MLMHVKIIVHNQTKKFKILSCINFPDGTPDETRITFIRDRQIIEQVKYKF